MMLEKLDTVVYKQWQVRQGCRRIRHHVLASYCAQKSPNRLSAILAKIASSVTSDWATVTYAHAVLASSCALKSSKRRFTILAKAASNNASDRAAVAHAHAVLASPCTLKSP